MADAVLDMNPYVSAPVVSNCSSQIASSYAVLYFRTIACLGNVTVQPTGSSTLLNVNFLFFVLKKGNTPQITSVDVRAIDGNGVAYRSNKVVLNPPVTPPARGLAFTIHIHADNLPMWELDQSSKPVRVIGTISLWDVVYTPIP